MTDDLRCIRVDQFLPHPPARVWRALTEPDLLARWLMPNDFRPAVGHRFTFRTTPIPAANLDGIAHCEVLEIDPERLLRISWAASGENALNSVVTWSLEPEGRGTRLFLEHDGFDPDDPIQRWARQSMGSGWPRMFDRIDQLLSEPPAPLSTTGLGAPSAG